jgi:hypothetical protein
VALGVIALVVGLGSWFPAVVFVALAAFWWGRALGVAALFGSAVALAAWSTHDGPAVARVTRAPVPESAPWAP